MRLSPMSLAICALVSITAPGSVAQAQIQAEVVIGRNGERIFLDPQTGEVLTVQPPAGVRELPPSRADRGWRELPVPQDRGFEREANIRDIIRAEREAERQRELEIREAMRREREEADRRFREQQRAAVPDPSQTPAEQDALPAPVPSSEPEQTTDLATRDDVSTGTVGSDEGVTEPAIEAPKGENAGLLPGRMTVAKAQILLDRIGASPGVIDGMKGQNVLYAMDSWRTLTGELVDFTNEAALDEALEARGGPAFTEYTITAEDVAGPYVAAIPEDYGEKAAMPGMSFTSTREALAERFHMDEDFLSALNPGSQFDRQGEVIRVASVGSSKTGKVARIVADKSREQVIAYDSSGRLVASYPATIGSSDTPSPSGTVNVERIAFNPNYTYDPNKNFKQGDNDKVLTIPPGPNGPVGAIWIALSKPTYGIHGTPEPSTIGKTASHGCVRLTNWDATELAKMVEPGTTVEFTE